MGFYDAISPGGTLGPVAEIISDPLAVLEAADAMSSRAAQPTEWMQKHRNNGVSTTRLGRVPTYEGRACCYQHLTRISARADLQMPFETTCPECSRVFRVTLGLVARR